MYVANYFTILSICHVLPSSCKKFPHCKARYHFYENKKSASLFSKMFFKTFIRLLYEMLDCALCLSFSSFPSAEELCVKYH